MTETSDSEALSHRPARRQVMLGAEISRLDGSVPTKHRMKDVSASGARIDRAGMLTAGATVRVSVGVLAAVEATVAWVKGDTAGLHFARPIDVDAARSKTLVTPPKPVADHRPLGAEPQATAGWVADLTNPYQRRRKPD